MAPSARAKLQADLGIAAERGIPNVQNIHKKDDGFVFTFEHPTLQSPHHVDIHVTPQDDTFLVYTDDSHIPERFADVLAESMEKSYGLRIPAMLEDLSRRLRVALEDNLPEEDKDTAMTDADISDFDTDDDDHDSDMQGGDDSDADFEYGDDDDAFGISSNPVSNVAQTARSLPRSTLHRIRQDLRAVREAGFKVGLLSGFDAHSDHSLISISVRVDKLCLSDETREAWNLDSSEFIVLLIRSNHSHYITFEDVLDRPAGQSNIEFRLRKCSRYKPTLQQAVSAFSAKALSTRAGSISSTWGDSDECEFSLLGIGSSIDLFMDKDFIPMLKLKSKNSLSWDSAKRYLSTLEKATTSTSEDIAPPPTRSENPNVRPNELPGFLVEDKGDVNGIRSLPLIATRFALRYLVRCTDYCMICHQKVEGNFEALKPYVCGDSLCLFQYMSLGFGPSIDYEIIRQPCVVDLLVSFCYTSLRPSPLGKPKLREFPTGLSLPVPNIRSSIGRVTDLTGTSRELSSAEGIVLVDPIEVTFDWDKSMVVSDTSENTQGLRGGQWIVISTPYGTKHSSTNVEIRCCTLHYGRIDMVSGRVLTVQIASRYLVPYYHQQVSEEELRQVHQSTTVRGHMVLFDQTLDDLEQDQKAFSMSLLLNTLPTISEMREFLTTNPGRQLASWDKMVPASMGLLRWIVASNRSYIVQIDRSPGDQELNYGKVASREHERISGVDGWVQFRFAQGSPEKEALFEEALGEVKKPQRTLLAWHGSPLGNWHSIIRQGLDYSVTEHGRAFGHGVYFSREFDTSFGYCSIMHSGDYSPAIWPKSTLKVDAALGLVELINRPEEFQSNNPYFVVQHLHWIQCRYLFVQCRQPRNEVIETQNIHTQHEKPMIRGEEFVQDAQFVTTGPRQKPLFVPKIAIPSASQNERRLPALSFKHDAQGHSGDTGDEDEGDIDFLFSNDEEIDLTTGSRPSSSKMGAIENLPPTPSWLEPRTDFRPGTLDLSTLPQLKPPSYATDLARRTLGKEIKKLEQVQSSTPLQELGWYIDFDKISNMFQWIVELHSFDLSLPLGQDMMTAGVNSIVLEIRFGREFPMSPPFVRVIRPRFLPFLEGGGGHVTAGGAMCMELLTTTGWSPANTIEAVLVQVRLALCSLEPSPARLQSCVVRYSRAVARDYGVGEAFDAYARAAGTHGWQVPRDQQEMRHST